MQLNLQFPKHCLTTQVEMIWFFIQLILYYINGSYKKLEDLCWSQTTVFDVVDSINTALKNFKDDADTEAYAILSCD